jgi:hypothetical protein
MVGKEWNALKENVSFSSLPKIGRFINGLEKTKSNLDYTKGRIA